MAYTCHELPPVAEQTTHVVTIEMLDAQGDPVEASSIDSIEVTLTAEPSCVVINHRQKQNALNANGFTVTDGEIVWQVSVEDTTIVGSTRPGQTELHKLTMTIVWDNGDQTAQVEILLPVINLRHVPQVEPEP